MNAYNPEANYGPAFFDARHNFVFSANYEIPYGRGRTHGSDISPVLDAVLGGWRLSGIYPGAVRLPDHGDRRAGAVAAGHARQRTAQLHRRSGSGGPGHQPLAGHLGLLPRGQGHVRQLRRRRGARAGLRERRRRACEAVQRRRPRYFEFRAEAFNLFNHPSFGPPARDINSPNAFGQITTTVSTARTMELVFKFFF